MGRRLMMLVATMALVVASCGGGTVETAGSASEQVGGIGIHGAWTVEVWNEDGTLEKHREFHNEFVGGRTLSRLIIHDLSWIAPGPFGVILDGSITCGTDLFCGITESNALHPSPPDPASKNLSVTLADSSSDYDFVVSGSLEVVNEGQVDRVRLFIGNCDEHFNHAGSCNASPFAAGFSSDPAVSRFSTGFTRTDLAPIDVKAGQIVQVEVEISFGTLTTP